MGSVHWRCREGRAWRPRAPSCRTPAWGRRRRGRPGWRGPGRGSQEGEEPPRPGWRAPWPRARGEWPGSWGGEEERLRAAPHCRWATCWTRTLICWGRWLESWWRTETETGWEPGDNERIFTANNRVGLDEIVSGDMIDKSDSCQLIAPGLLLVVRRV